MNERMERMSPFHSRTDLQYLFLLHFLFECGYFCKRARNVQIALSKFVAVVEH